MDPSDQIVFVVDDEEQVRVSIVDLLRSAGHNAVPLASAADYLSIGARPRSPACLVLDVDLPELNGLELQVELAGMDHPPIVFITGYGDVPSSVSAMKRGAVDFLTKPFDASDLLAAVRTALEIDALRIRQNIEVAELEERYLRLTPREREVLPLVTGGLLNKQAAAQLGISEVTLQIHRSRVMQKMEASSLAELVRMAERLRIPISFSRYGGAFPHEATVIRGRDC